MTDLAKLTAVLEAEITEWSSGLKGAQEQLDKFSEHTTDVLKDIAGAFGIYLSVDSLVEWGKSLIEQDANLDRFSQETGIAVEQLSALDFALESGGVAADKLSVIFRDLQKNISSAAGDSTGTAATAFRLLGINVEDASGHLKDTETITKEVADKFAALEDGANKTAIAVALFGRNGQELIPTLDKGGQGISDLEDKARSLGIAISGDTAKAAEEFETDLTNLGIVVKDGLGERIKQSLLPALDSLVKSFTDTATGAQKLDDTADGITDFLKGIAVVGLNVANIFEDLGLLIGGLAAIAVAPISQTVGLVGGLMQDLTKQDEDFAKREQALFEPLAQGISDLGDSWDTLHKKEAPNLAAEEAREKAAAEAVKQLQDFDNTLKVQIAGLQDGGDAAAKYQQKLTELAKAVAQGGDAGKALAASIQADIDTFKKLTDAKTITDGMAKINEQLDKLKGNDADAGVAKLDIEFQKTITTLRQAADAGDAKAAADLKQYDALVTLTAANDDFEKDLKTENDLQESLTNTIKLLTDQFNEGKLGQADYLKAVSDAQIAVAGGMGQVLVQLQAIQTQTGNPQQAAQIAKLTTGIADLQSEAGKAGQALEKSIGQDATNALLELENGTASAGKAFSDFVGGIQTELLKLADQKIIDSLFGTLIGATGGGASAGIFGTVAGLFSGGKASGGDVTGGLAYRINENTPNSEYFIPKTAGTVVPASSLSGSGISVVNHFTIQTPDGKVSRQTQAQIGATAYRGLALANARNN